MKEISYSQIKAAVSNALLKACTVLDPRVFVQIKKARKEEDNPLAKETLRQIEENARLAKKESLPMCQDTGIVTCFVELGTEVHLNCDLNKAINAGVKEAYRKYYFRKSVADPLTRLNTQDNTPAIIHVESKKGDHLKLVLCPKGAGSENMSALKMLSPTDGIEGIKKFVLDTVRSAGGKPCPPIIVGLGIGGNFETAPYLAKKALLRKKKSKDPALRKLEEELVDELNALGIGPMGLGGKTTCFDVYAEALPCHIASLPVAVNIQCHAARHEEVVL